MQATNLELNENSLNHTDEISEIQVDWTNQKKPEQKIQKEVLHQDNIFEIDMQIESDLEGGLSIENDCITGSLTFLQVPSYQIDSSISDTDLTIELMQEI